MKNTFGNHFNFNRKSNNTQFYLIIIIYNMENDDLNLALYLLEPQMQICKLKYEGKTYRDIHVLTRSQI